MILPLVGLHSWWAKGPYVGQPPASAKQGEALTVMSSNLSYGEANPSRVVEVAVKNETDILVVTEITPIALKRMRAAGLHRAFPYSQGETADGVAGTTVFSTYDLAQTEKLNRRSAASRRRSQSQAECQGIRLRQRGRAQCNGSA